MRSQHLEIVRLVAIGMVAVFAIVAPAFGQDSCQPIYDALTKTFGTPSHSYASFTEVSGGKPTSMEFIFVQNKTFMKAGNRWTDGPMSPKELLADELQKRKTAHPACRVVRSEVKEGQPATLYSLHSKTENTREDAQIWVSEQSGLLLREEADIALSGTEGTKHLSNHYEYTNVYAPK